ncbi:MAG: tyrosine-type recombinase/integrase [Gammaproteobacteria bacterium]|nr:tyrosine-type recombinase/integrase [Gammaproteobacteria bacterium]
MAINKLNSKFCNNAPTGTHFDGEGLYLLVKPDGKKYWRMACYLHGKRKLLSFGTYPKVSLAEAREERINAQKLLSQGIDPVQQAKAEKLGQAKAIEQAAIETGNTFEQIARRLHAHKTGKTTEDYRNLMLRQLEIHVFPVIGSKHITDITGAELITLFKGVAEKTNHGRAMTYMARKLCNWSGEVFDLASAENNNFTNNPCRAIIKLLPTHSTQNMARISFDQLPQFLKSLKIYGGYALTKAAIWTLLYTGMRQASARKALWQDFDLEAGIWNRQPEKSDKSIHALPLPHQAVSLLNEIKPLTGGKPTDLVFPSVYSNYRPMSEAAVCQALNRMNYHMVGHGLRGVVSTGLNELGFKPHVVDVQLGHKKESSVEGAYNHAKHLQERREMMQAWADYLESKAKLD